MKAAVLHEAGSPLQIEEVPDPIAGPGEAVVSIRAASLNHRDVWIRKGQYAGLKFPCIIGSDGVGVVESVGSEADRHWVGTEVIINPSIGWGAREEAQDFSSFQILGLPTDGTFAEKTKVPCVNLAAMPPNYEDKHAAALPLAGLTAFRAVMVRGKAVKNDQILVNGAGGGAASFAIQIAAALGAKVWVTSGSESKIRDAVEMGAAGGVSYKEADWEKKLKEQAGGFDLVIDSAGGEGFGKLIDLANQGGRIVFYGATLGNPSTIELRKIFWKQISLLGTTMGSPADFAMMLQFFSDRHIKPKIDTVMEFAEVNAALDRMERGEQHGKIVLRMPG